MMFFVQLAQFRILLRAHTKRLSQQTIFSKDPRFFVRYWLIWLSICEYTKCKCCETHRGYRPSTDATLFLAERLQKSGNY
jgi:hypothetical protein